MPIDSLYFAEFGPFDEIEFELDHQVNVFTGPNNAGKTAALLMLGELLVFPFTAPDKLYRSQNPRWKLRYASGTKLESIGGALPTDPEELVPVYEAIGHTCFLPAQRAGTDFRASGPSASQEIESRTEELTKRIARARPKELRRHGFERLRDYVRLVMNTENSELKKRRDLALTDSSWSDDKEIVQKIIDLDYAAYRQNRPEIRNVIHKIVSMVSEITEGFPMRFAGVGQDEGGLFPQVASPSGVVPLDVLSQGTQSVIHCLAHVTIGQAEYYGFPTDLGDKPGVVVIDEIDAHLHPSWQRRIIPTMTRHFPNLQIFCSTHSPLMLAGLKAGQVQLLRRGKDGKVSVSRNETDIAGWSADEILRNFLEVPAPTDMTTAAHVTRLEELRHKEELTSSEADELETLRRAVGSELLRGPMSAQVEQFTDELKRARGKRSAR